MKKIYLILCFFLLSAIQLEAVETICSENECYTVIEKLGEGAFGVVYSVEDSQGQKYALKSYRTRNNLPSNVFEDLAREYQRGQELNHQNIIKSVDMFTDSSNEEITSNLLLQLVEGKTLFDVAENTLSPLLTFNTISQFCDAIRYALSENLLHFDLHDGNIMMANNHEIMVVDLASFFTLEEFIAFVEEMEAQPKYAKLDQGLKLDLGLKGKKMKQFLKRIEDFSENSGENNRLAAKATIVKHLDPNLVLMVYYSTISAVGHRLLTKSSIGETDKLWMKKELEGLDASLLVDYQAGNSIGSDDFFEKLISIFQPFALVD